MIAFNTLTKIIYMSSYFKRCFIVLLCGFLEAGAQKPAIIQINSFISRIPLPESSATCYGSATIVTATDGTVTVKDNGEQFNTLNDQLDKLTKDYMASVKAASAAPPTAAPTQPTPEQIEQMQQQAMQRAQQAMQSGGNPAAAAQAGAQTKHTYTNVALMQELGKAQSAIMPMNQLITELTGKLGQVRMEQVPMGPNCPEVQQGGYAGPLCSCTKDRNVTYEERSVAARNDCLGKINSLLHQYIPQIEQQVAIVDKLESDAKFGEGITDPATLQMLTSVQRQALGGFTAILGIASGSWTDGANQYARLVNAKSVKCKQ